MAAQLRLVRRRVLALAENRAHKLRIAANTGKRGLAINEVCANNLQALPGSGLLQACARVRQQLFDLALRSLRTQQDRRYGVDAPAGTAPPAVVFEEVTNG